jgi:DNA invertase Pin-like site-specific DNA recombinase
MTGRRFDRPGYQSLLTEVRRLRAHRQSVVVVVAALDRFGRDLEEQVRSRKELRTLKVPLHAVREGGEPNDLLANVLSAVAQDESERLGQRVREARRHIMAQGYRPVGKVAWGYRLQDATSEEREAGAPRRVLVEDPATAPFVRETFRRFADGQSFRKLAAWIAGLPGEARGEFVDDEGHVHPARILHYQRVCQLLRSPIYVARWRRDDGDDVLKGPKQKWPALIDDALWARVQGALKDHSRRPRQASGKYLLTGVIRCSQCCARMTGWPSKHQPYRYMCVNAAQTTCSYSVPGEIVESAVLAEVSAILSPCLGADPRLRSGLRQAWDRLRNPGDAEAQRRSDIMWHERCASDARRRLVDAMKKLVDGIMTEQDYQMFRDHVQAELETAEREVSRLRVLCDESSLPDLATVIADAGGWSVVLRQGDIPMMREVLGVLIDRVVPERVRRGQYLPTITWTPLGEALGRLRKELTE